MTSLDGKVAIVAGAGPGIGRACATALRREGADVVVAARDAGRLEAMAVEIVAADAADPVTGPVGPAGTSGARTSCPSPSTSPTWPRAGCWSTRRWPRLGRIDVLVNVATAGGETAAVAEGEWESWRRAFEVNVIGTMELSRLAAHAMAPNPGGSIVQIGTIGTRALPPGRGRYTATKSAMVTASLTMAKELGRAHVRVNVVTPGFITGAPLSAMIDAIATRTGESAGRRLRPHGRRRIAAAPRRSRRRGRGGRLPGRSRRAQHHGCRAPGDGGAMKWRVDEQDRRPAAPRAVAVPLHGDGGRLRPGRPEPRHRWSGSPCSSTASRPSRASAAAAAWPGPGDNAIEIGQPIGDGAAAQFVERFGGGMHSIALQVEDLEATMAHLQQEEVHIAARPRPEMCFSDPRDTGGVFFQWSTFELAVDPRFGAPLPDPLPAARVLAPATHHAFVGALVDDPSAWAGRFATLLGTDRDLRGRRRRPGPSHGRRVARRLHARPLPVARGRRPRAVGPHLRAGRAPTCWRCASRTSGRRPTRSHRAGITIVRWGGGLVVLDPAATGGVQIALTGALLPGDPRL